MSFDDLFRKDGLTRRCSEPPTSSAIFTMLPPAGIGPAGETKDYGENMKPTSRPNGEAASANITKRIEELGDWRGETLAYVRQLIHDADPDIEEEWKWDWEPPSGPMTAASAQGNRSKQVVKLTFFRGASIKDPKKLFNSSLEGNTRRAIDLREGGRINKSCLQATHPRRGGGQFRSARSTGSQEEVSPALRFGL